MHAFPDGLLPGPFTAEQAIAAGVSRQMLRGSRVRRVFHGVYVGADVPDDLEMRCRAALLVLPAGCVFSHGTAALLHGFTVPSDIDQADAPLHVLSRLGHVPRVKGVHGHEGVAPDDDVVRLRQLPVTSLERTWLDLGNYGWHRDDLVVCTDALLRRHGSDLTGRLEQRLDAATGHRGVRALRVALGMSAFPVDSPMETRLRLLLRDAGLPAPAVNRPVRDDEGDVLHVPDLSWPNVHYAVDYDGAHHLQWDDDADVRAGRRDNWRRRQDIGRQEVLREWGWTLTVVTAFDLLRQPAQLVSRVRTELRKRGASC